MSVNSEVINREQPINPKRNHGTNVGDLERVASLVAGGALAVFGLSRRSTLGWLSVLVGAALAHRGGTGYCHAYQALGVNTATTGLDEIEVARDIHIEKSIIIDKSPEELYRYWREFENLPRIMTHLESVTNISLKRSHWKAKGPVGSTLEWDAEIYNEKPDEFIAWRSLDGEVTNAGSVHFQPAPGERGTLLRVVLNYNVPGGKVSALLAKLFGREPGQMIEEDLRRLKQLMETGEIASIEGQPSARAQSAEVKANTDDSPERQSRAASAR
ncbi:MAG: hypothetical protein QOD75_3949 [Blastocatellia bacterium]|jgi:uncharacterized membrane protein|nr:hypothetical protein [Blastocatellia bacterium]